jgi:hypothetical protein
MGKRLGRKVGKDGRSEGEPRFIQLPYWIMETPAFLALSSGATRALLFMLKRFNGVNNGKIAFGVRSGCFTRRPGTPQLEDCPILSKSEMGRALRELQAAGFIRCTQEATFDQKRHTREWRLTWLPSNGQPPTKEFASERRPQNPETSPTGGTMGPITVPRAGQHSTQNEPTAHLQSHGRDYARLP